MPFPLLVLCSTHWPSRNQWGRGRERASSKDSWWREREKEWKEAWQGLGVLDTKEKYKDLLGKDLKKTWEPASGLASSSKVKAYRHASWVNEHWPDILHISYQHSTCSIIISLIFMQIALKVLSVFHIIPVTTESSECVLYRTNSAENVNQWQL